MKEPSIWKELGKYIHEDFIDDYPDFFSGILEFTKNISSNEKVQLTKYLNYLVTTDLPGGTLKKCWKDSRSGIIVVPKSNNKWIVFYTKMLETVESV